MALVDRVELVGLDRVRVSARNPRRGDVAAIKRSLVANEQYAPVIVNRSTGEVLAGNHRVLAARELGWQQIAVCYVEVDDQHARRILLADNRTSDLAGYDTQALVALLEQTASSLDGTGYSADDLDVLLDSLSTEAPLGDDVVPPLPAEPRCQPGEVVELGVHRLACGDACDAKLLDRLMTDEEAACVVTDPPYGAEYEGKTRERLRIQNDHATTISTLLPAVLERADRHVAQGAAFYVVSPSSSGRGVFIDALAGVGWGVRQSLVWVKDQMVLGHADYHHQHELVLYGYKPRPGGGRLGRGGSGWRGGTAAVSVFEVPRPRSAVEHPTMKPPELLAQFVRNSSRRGDLVLDPFAGSGSTLVACERLRRRARLVEVDPRYCDVIVRRYEQLVEKGVVV
jgi:DNA modification methylase